MRTRVFLLHTAAAELALLLCPIFIGTPHHCLRHRATTASLLRAEDTENIALSTPHRYNRIIIARLKRSRPRHWCNEGVAKEACKGGFTPLCHDP